MKDQIMRARVFFVEAEKGVRELDKDSRWPVSNILFESPDSSVFPSTDESFVYRGTKHHLLDNQYFLIGEPFLSFILILLAQKF